MWGLPIVVIGVVVFLIAQNSRAAGSRYATAIAERGDVAETVGATGTLQAVTTVQVGSQVSGNIMSLGADFNSTVKKGQVVARLEPSAYEARLAQMNANYASAVANVERTQAALEDAKQKFDRARSLKDEGLLPQSDYETAQSTYQGAVAQVKANQAAVKQAEANVSQAQVDLAHTVITAPIDGVVIARNVDVGQTVAASLQAPVLFVIANDLTHMEVNASIDEADIGRVKADQEVSFRVDSYPTRDFSGTVSQVRLQPVVSQNVVTYNTIISVANPDQKLMPGMTATVSVVTTKREGVIRLPAAALRFRPEGFEEPVSARGAGGIPGAGSGGREGRSRGEGRSGRTGGADRGAGADGGSAGRPGTVFVLDEKGQPQPTRVRVGLSDGRFTEVVEGVSEGARVITGDEVSGTRPVAAASAAPGGNNPFAPGRPQPRTR
jgi:HlyD family secretion protein